ncbi:N-acetyltransferase [Kitasatospora herbaricolor]|uniref:GNAT family N-acetyltransferase n=1 Tax=Kitasatospora herbaricolor TaxID=68217 RepID=UPI00174DFD32|nr:GNAT family N-acetyltransferase [Kitasatospora herbaricolor]MDQ0306307.1 GNAT superfamily N-acetyltransferase [Kitasatospora herbaricolor]GGV40256.1 N-acetyltransferase [Kitasatospora herbaricolor]
MTLSTATATTAAPAWAVAPAAVTSPEAVALLRDYLIDVSDRYYLRHQGRVSTSEEIEEGLAAFPSDDLAPPTGLFLLGRLGGRPQACAGLRVLDPGTVELTRVFVRSEARGSGGGARLLAAVDEAARALGARRIVLDTRLDLVEARALYTRHGYAEIPAYSNGPYAEVWYGKDLTAAVPAGA